MDADTRRSNITPDDAKKRGFKLQAPEQTRKLTTTDTHDGAYVWSIYMPYFDINGKRIEGYYRVRYLEEVLGPRTKKGRKLRKYTGPKGARIYPYFDPACDYKKVSDNGELILIVEGEKKAACAVKDGYIAIGIGGVSCWQQNGGPLPEFDLIDWEDRDVVLFFDSDYRGKPDVKRELNKLARELKRRGATVRRAEPPDDENGEKQGYDDCRKNLGKRATTKIVNDAVPFELPDDAIDLLNEVWFVAPEGSNVGIYNELTGFVYKEQDFKLLYANRFVLDEDGKRKPLGRAWLESPDRRQYSETIFDPDAAPDPYVYNRYKPCAIDPAKGDWSLYEEHMRDNICAGNAEYYDYLFGWLARGVQQKSKQAEVAVVLRGPQGTGKGVFVSSYAELFKPHFFHASSAHEITGQFSGHLKDTLLLFLDEAFFAGDKKHVGALKKIITENTRSVEAKYKDAIAVSNRLKIMLASNEHWVIPAGNLERRFLVLDVGTGRQQDTKYFGAVKRQLSNGGYSAFLYDLLNYNLAEFDHRAVPRTDALAEQQVFSFSDVELYWSGLLDDGEMPSNAAKIKGQEIGDFWRVVSKQTLYRNFLTQAKDRGLNRLPDIKQFRLQLEKLLPDGWPHNSRLSLNGKRVTCWEFPPLNACRAHFEKCRGVRGKSAKRAKDGEK